LSWGGPPCGARDDLRGGDHEKTMVYSPRPMEDACKSREMEELEEKVHELEKIAGSLGDVPDEELAATLAGAVELLREINARIEARVEAAGEESRGADSLLSGVDFGPFDEALEDLERRERSPGEPGP
jgi:hypothetical protein